LKRYLLVLLHLRGNNFTACAGKDNLQPVTSNKQ
jgi:hypothetical protein